MLTEASQPRFAPGVRLRQDGLRGQWVVLAPERLLQPDAQALAILRRIDGESSVASIIDALVAEYGAPRAEIAEDTLALLRDLAARGILRA